MILELMLLQISEPQQNVTLMEQLYTSCGKAEATKLEPSGEPAEVVADVVVTRCEIFIPKAYDEFIVNFRNRPEVKSFEADGNKSYLNYDLVRPQLMDRLRHTLHGIAVAQVVEVRAARGSKK